jgi:hypothetical protein
VLANYLHSVSEKGRSASMATPEGWRSLRRRWRWTRWQQWRSGEDDRRSEVLMVRFTNAPPTYVHTGRERERTRSGQCESGGWRWHQWCRQWEERLFWGGRRWPLRLWQVGADWERGGSPAVRTGKSVTPQVFN